MLSAASGVAPQPAGAQTPPLRSPEILPDGRVTFRLMAPQATSVVLNGDWPGGIHNSTVPMVKDDTGVWSTTVGPLKPEFWIYTFTVDGVSMLDPQNVHIRRNGARYANTLLISGPESADYAVNSVPHGTVSLIWYPSTTLNLTRRTYVYTPPGYETGQGRYPVFYLLHGGGGDEDAWNTCARASEILDNLIARGKAKPMIVVMPNGNANQSASQDYMTNLAPPGFGRGANMTAPSATPGSGPSGGQGMITFPTSLVKDLIPFIDKVYRTRSDRENRAIGGLSMGGAQTFYAAFNYVDQFAWIASFSAGYTFLPGVGVPIPAPANAAELRGPDLTRSVDPEKIAALLPQLNSEVNAKLHLLYISIGTADTLNSAHDVVRKLLNERGVNYTLKEFPGYIHEWPVWRVSLLDLLPKLFQPTAR
jgi:enterochelin esterase family protein